MRTEANRAAEGWAWAGEQRTVPVGAPVAAGGTGEGSRVRPARSRNKEPAPSRPLSPPGAAGKSAATPEPSAPSGGAGDGGGLLGLTDARQALGLGVPDFDAAVQLGEVPLVPCGSRSWRVRAEDVERLLAEPDHPAPLLDRTRLVGSAAAAHLLGVGQTRFVRLARAGFFRPVRWYVNRYHALVWLYAAGELPAFAERSPALLRGPLPLWLREAVAAGQDERARGWRARRAAQLVRDAADPWDEAAVWAALLGHQMMAAAVPDAAERAHLRFLRPEFPPGRAGAASPEQVRAVTTADHPDEIALALLALADTLHRARAVRPAPTRHSAEPPLTARFLSPTRPGPAWALVPTAPGADRQAPSPRPAVTSSVSGAAPVHSASASSTAPDVIGPISPAPVTAPGHAVPATAPEGAVPAAVPGQPLTATASTLRGSVVLTRPADCGADVRRQGEEARCPTPAEPRSAGAPGAAPSGARVLRTGADSGADSGTALVRVPADKAVLPRPLPTPAAAAPVVAPPALGPDFESPRPVAAPAAGAQDSAHRQAVFTGRIVRPARSRAQEQHAGRSPVAPGSARGSVGGPDQRAREGEPTAPGTPARAPGGRHARPTGGPGGLLRLLLRGRAPGAGSRQEPLSPRPPARPPRGAAPEQTAEGRPAAGPEPAGRSGRDRQSSPTDVIRRTARPSSSEAARSTSAEMPQP